MSELSSDLRPYERTNAKPLDGNSEVALTRDQDVVNTGSESDLKLASHWLADCIDTHESCKSSTEELTAWMPNRLLDVGQSWSTDPCLIDSVS